MEVTNIFKGLDLVDRECLKNYRWKSVIQYSRQWQKQKEGKKESGCLKMIYRYLRKEEKIKATEKWKDIPNRMKRIVRRYKKNFFTQLHSVQFRTVTQLFLTLQPNGRQQARLPCPSPTPGAWKNSCPLSWWCHPTISSYIVPFSSCLQYFPASEPFSMSHFFNSGGQSFGASASASVLPMNIQDWFTLALTGLISL